MKVEDGEVGPAHAYVIVGDGIRDIRILRALAEKYNHRRILRSPQTIFKSGKGVEGLIRQLISLIECTRMDKYLALIDREHVENTEQLLEKFREHGFNVSRVEQPVEGYYRLELSRGSKKVIVYLAILGWRRAVEEKPREACRETLWRTHRSIQGSCE